MILLRKSIELFVSLSKSCLDQFEIIKIFFVPLNHFVKLFNFLIFFGDSIPQGCQYFILLFHFVNLLFLSVQRG